jgi:hypothetical protein
VATAGEFKYPLEHQSTSGRTIRITEAHSDVGDDIENLVCIN